MYCLSTQAIIVFHYQGSLVRILRCFGEKITLLSKAAGLTNDTTAYMRCYSQGEGLDRYRTWKLGELDIG